MPGHNLAERAVPLYIQSVSFASRQSTFVFNCHINCFDIAEQRLIKYRPVCGGGHPHEKTDQDRNDS